MNSMIDQEILEKNLKRTLMYLSIALREDITYTGPDYFKDIMFVQNILSDVSPDEVELNVEFFGKKLEAPIMISPLVGGFKEAISINKSLAAMADAKGLAMGVGNEAFMFKENPVLESYSVVRDEFPDLFVFGNVHSKYLPLFKEPVEAVKEMIDLIKADGFLITLSPLTEMFYSPQATRGGKFSNYIESITKEISVPIFARSYSSGFAHEEVRKLWDAGIDGIDSQGMGGADIIRIERFESMTLAQKQSPEKAHVFDNWGLHTIWSLLDIKLREEHRKLPLIVGGGIRNGLQAVKCLALGADIISIGYPMLLQFYEDITYPDAKNMERFLFRLIYEMKMVMASLGVRNLKELRNIAFNRLFIKGETREWVNHRNLFHPSFNKER